MSSCFDKEDSYMHSAVLCIRLCASMGEILSIVLKVMAQCLSSVELKFVLASVCMQSSSWRRYRSKFQEGFSKRFSRPSCQRAQQYVVGFLGRLREEYFRESIPLC